MSLILFLRLIRGYSLHEIDIFESFSFSHIATNSSLWNEYEDISQEEIRRLLY